jgi:hypothetical protein
MESMEDEFLKEAFAAIGAEVKETPGKIWDVTLPAAAAPQFDDRAQLALTFDREVYRTSERDVELVVAGSPLFESILGALGPAGAASAVAFEKAPDPIESQKAARGALTVRGGRVTADVPAVEALRGHAVLLRLRIEGPEREDLLTAVFVPAQGDERIIGADALAKLAREGKPAALAKMLPGDRNALRDRAVAAALRDGERRCRAAEQRSAGRLAKEIQQVRAYFEALGAELKEAKAEGRGEEGRKEAAARLRNLERERDLRLGEVTERFRAHAAAEPAAVLMVDGKAARVGLVFEAGARKLRREVVAFPPLGPAAPPPCDLCGAALAEAAICGDPAHDVLLCAACRRYCQTCGAGLCSQHTKSCACGAVACPAHGAACEACGVFCCEKHRLRCMACCRSFCAQHAHECGVCRLIGCFEHSKRCGSCQLELCPEHAVTCDLTGKPACPQHLKSCGECGENVLDIAIREGKCTACGSLLDVPPGDPAVAAAVAYLPVAANCSWKRADTKTRIRLEGKTFLNRYRVWLDRELKPIAAWGGSRLFGMKKLRG